MVGFMRSIFGERVLTHPMVKSTAIADAGLTKQTLYEVERQQFTRATYDRAIEALDLRQWRDRRPDQTGLGQGLKMARKIIFDADPVTETQAEPPMRSRPQRSRPLLGLERTIKQSGALGAISHSLGSISEKVKARRGNRARSSSRAK